jgi:RNA polymerase sigma factor (sigma-70 family)
MLGDDRLARLTANGSDRAFAVLYERHHQALYRYCRTIVRHDEDARDVLQTTMMRALAALGRGLPDAPVRPWLFRIAHNEAVSVLRRRRPTIDLDQAPEPATRDLEARVEQRSRLTALVADLNELPDRQRGALVMRELSGLSHEEIAAALDISVSAAKQAIFDARTGLHEFATGRAMDCAEVERIVSARDGRMLRGRPVRAHLRACESCRALRDAIRARRTDLAALAPPLPAATATGLFSGILGSGSHGGGAGGLTSGVAAKVASAAAGTKALTGAAVVATVAVGATQVAPRLDPPAARRAAPAAGSSASAAGGAARGPVAASSRPAAGPAGADRTTIAATASAAVKSRTTTSTGSQHRSAAAAGGAAAAPASSAGHLHAGTTAHAGAGHRPAAAKAPSQKARRATPAHESKAHKPKPAKPKPAKPDQRAKPTKPTAAKPAKPAKPTAAKPAKPTVAKPAEPTAANQAKPPVEKAPKPPSTTPPGAAAPPAAAPATPQAAAPATPPAAAPAATPAGHGPPSKRG